MMEKEHYIQTSKLKPCPFCGSENIDMWANGGFDERTVYAGCSRCQFTLGGHLIPELNTAQQSEAICRQWNQRYRDFNLEHLMKENPTLKDSFDTFNELYRIATGKDYMEKENDVERTFKKVE